MPTLADLKSELAALQTEVRSYDPNTSPRALYELRAELSALKKQIAAQTPKLQDVREALRADTISRKDDVITIRRGFFYTNGFTAEKLEQRVRAAYPSAQIVDSGEIWKTFRGGASVAQSSHWFVKFTL